MRLIGRSSPVAEARANFGAHGAIDFPPLARPSPAR
jgi:hypothetical protein